MVIVKPVQGFGRALFLARVKLSILVHFLPLLFRRDRWGGARLSPRKFIRFLQRLLLFLSKLDHNKFVSVGKRTRMDLYVPGFPGPAFFWGARKFASFAGSPPPVTVLISVTSACRFACEHCYQRLDQGHDVPLEPLIKVVRLLQDQGIAFFNIEGGEPFLRYDRLRTVCAAIDSRSEVWINSTGDGITSERLRELKAASLTAVMFSLHTAQPERLNDFMGSPKAWDTLLRGVEQCHEADVPVAFNACLGREAFYNGEFEAVMQKAKALNACLVQLIQPKPAGAWLESGPQIFSPPDFQRVHDLVWRYNHDPDRADYPCISAQVLEEDRTRFGCTAGGVDRFYINAKGDVQPCEFLNVSFGNIAREDFRAIYARMRSCFEPPCETWLCEACAPEIARLRRAGSGSVLPLGPAVTRELTAKWNRGKATDFYRKVKELR